MNDLSIYQEKILSLAAENKKSNAIEDYNRSFEVKNPMCGDEVKVRLKLINNQIEDISAIVRGCALCEASAGLVVKLFKNNRIPSGNGEALRCSTTVAPELPEAIIRDSGAARRQGHLEQAKQT